MTKKRYILMSVLLFLGVALSPAASTCLAGDKNKDVMKTLTILIAPFAPHIAEELWEMLGGEGSVCDAHWPLWNEEYLVENQIKMGVQFNGKVRFEMLFAADADNQTIEQAVREDERTAKYVEGKQIVKIIIVPKRMINVVLR